MERIVKKSIIGLLIFISLVFITKSAESKHSRNFGNNIENSRKNKKDAEIREAEVMMENIEFALDHYKLDNGMYPTTEQGLKALVKKSTVPPVPSNWRGPYLGWIPIDPWGKPYNYACQGVHNKDSYDLSSYGPDGVDTRDGIINWNNSK